MNHVFSLFHLFSKTQGLRLGPTVLSQEHLTWSEKPHQCFQKAPGFTMSSTEVMISKATKDTTLFPSSCCLPINVGEKLRWRREIMKQRFTSSKRCLCLQITMRMRRP